MEHISGKYLGVVQKHPCSNICRSGLDRSDCWTRVSARMGEIGQHFWGSEWDLPCLSMGESRLFTGVGMIGQNYQQEWTGLVKLSMRASGIGQTFCRSSPSWAYSTFCGSMQEWSRPFAGRSGYNCLSVSMGARGIGQTFWRNMLDVEKSICIGYNGLVACFDEQGLGVGLITQLEINQWPVLWSKLHSLFSSLIAHCILLYNGSSDIHIDRLLFSSAGPWADPPPPPVFFLIFSYFLPSQSEFPLASRFSPLQSRSQVGRVKALRHFILLQCIHILHLHADSWTPTRGIVKGSLVISQIPLYMFMIPTLMKRHWDSTSEISKCVELTSTSEYCTK